jgi:hypothetical protein
VDGRPQEGQVLIHLDAVNLQRWSSLPREAAFPVHWNKWLKPLTQDNRDSIFSVTSRRQGLNATMIQLGTRRGSPEKPQELPGVY